MSLPTKSRPLLMGILNVTPDSFSNEGEHFDQDVAINHAIHMASEGADIIDIGGESTRPGAGRVSAEQQIERVLPVIRQVRSRIPENIHISIDTTSSVVASAAIDAGATVINDVSAGRDDEAIFALAAENKTTLVLMHMQGSPDTMQDNPVYEDVVNEIITFLLERAGMAERAGIKKEDIFIDPGIGFGKTKQDNLDIMANLDKFVKTGYGVLLGASRKRFMGSICNVEKYSDLVAATCATTVLAILAGVSIVRVHDVRENRQVIDVINAVRT